MGSLWLKTGRSVALDAAEAPAAVVSAVDQVRALESRAADPRPLCRDPWCPRRVDVPGRLCAEHLEQHKPRPGVESRATVLGLRGRR